MDKEALWCLGDWAKDTDYVLCAGDGDLLPKLYKKDEIRYSYNQYKNKRSYVSCTIFAAVGMASDLTNYEFSYDEIKDVDDTSYNNPDYEHIRLPWQWWYVSDAVDHMRKRWNSNEKLVKKYWKLASYRISKYNDDVIEDAINNLYTIDWNLCPTKEWNADKKDWIVDWKDFWTNTNWHSIDIVCLDGQRSVKDSWSMPYYWLKHKLSEISNIWPNFYIFTLVNENNYEEIKRLNEIKAKIVSWMDINSELWHLSGSETHKNKLHDMNNFFRDWLSYIDGGLKSLV